MTILRRIFAGGLLRQIIVGFVLVLVVFGTIQLTTQMFFSSRVSDRLMDDTGHQQALFLARLTSVALFTENRSLAKEPLDAIVERPEIVSASLYHHDGTIWMEHTTQKTENTSISPDKAKQILVQMASAKPLRKMAADTLCYYAPVTVTNFSIMDSTTEAVEAIGLARVVLNKKYFQNLTRQRFLLNSISFFSAMLVALFLAIFLARYLSKPLHRLTEGARHIAKGELDRPIPVETTGELASLTIAFNQMLESLKEREQLMLKLQQAQRMEAIGLMAGGVAHDLNNILSGVVGYPELMLLDLPEDSKLRKPIKAIYDSGTRAAAIVADLLTVARGVASTKELQDLNSLAQEYLDSPEYNKLTSLYPQITCKTQFAAAHPSIFCSSVHVIKCLMNLVTNASEAVEPAGMVIISTENQTIEDNEATKHGIEPGEYVVLNVADNGPGIKDIDLERIFEPFFSKKVMGRSGTGLGLSIVWNTMKDHNGVVLVDSSAKGTRFQLFFPMGKEKETTKIDSDVAEDITGNGEHILLVDDEPHLRDIGSRMLETLGYVVDSVCSGELALQFVQETPVDLIVLDMLMEPGMNGRHTYEEIIKVYPGQKAIIASGFSESDDVKKALQLGVAGFIKKPYSRNQLGQAVKRALNK